VGSDHTYPEEGPRQEASVQDFWIDRSEVTVAQFGEFVGQTGYLSVAERPVDPATLPDVPMTPEQRSHFISPGGAVFDPSESETPRDLRWWTYVPGASWKYPQGPDRPAAKPNHPVTQIALEDALAYAQWAGGRLPSEAEWEVAASLGSKRTRNSPDAPVNANTWQGAFPVLDEASDGYAGVAPVGCFEANDIGLYDMLGNVWEWTSDGFSPRRDQSASPRPISLSDFENSPAEGTIKGGSFLCAPNYCMRYRPSARQAQETGLGTNHIGIRVVYDHDPNAGK
jgi:formylglycine-generating enzyme required for sulfatase activity